MFDYGAPTGFRLAMVTLIGHGHHFAEWERIRRESGRRLGADPKVLGAPTEKTAHTSPKYSDCGWNTLAVHRGGTEPEAVPPETYTLDTALLERPGNKEISFDLFLDYASNVKLYPKFQDTSANRGRLY